MTIQRAVEPETPVVEKIKIDLDDRAFLMPMGKPITHILISSSQGGKISLDAIFAFNICRDGNSIATLTLDEAKSFVGELLFAVYSAKTQTAILDTINVTINVLVNGYQMEFVRHESRITVFLGTAPIWRFIRGLLQVIDSASPIASN